MSGVFISYARDDDEPFAEGLYQQLTQNNVPTWRDRHSLRSRGISFLQEIRDGIADFDRLLLVIGPEAMRSDYVAAEWKFAYETCRVIIPVLRLGDFSQIPKPLGKLHCIEFRESRPYEEALEELLRNVREPVDPLGHLHDVDELPANYLPRDEEIDRVADVVLADSRDATVITSTLRTAALQGMGGVGKSVMAAAFARQCETRRAFPDGIFWVRLGQSPDLSKSFRILAEAIGAPGLSPHHRVARSDQERPDLVCLIVLDDLWDVGHVEAVWNALPTRARLLITTRDAGISGALGAQEVSIDVLPDDEALELLGRWSNRSPDELGADAREVAKECGNLPLALAMVGAMAKGRRERWPNVLDKLRKADLDKIRKQFPNYPYPDLLRAFQVSVDALEADVRARFVELGIFPEDTLVPERTLCNYWRSEDFSEFDAQDVLDVLVKRSLLKLEHDGRFSLHDLLLDYARAEAGASLRELHRRFLDSYRGSDGSDWTRVTDDGYIYSRLAYHLTQAGLESELENLLDQQLDTGDSAWFLAKMRVDPSGTTFIDDLNSLWRIAEQANADAARADETAPNLAREVQCALSIASLSTQSSNIKPDLILILLAIGAWTTEHAFSLAWHIRDVDTRAKLIEVIAPYLDVPQIERAVRWYFHEQPPGSFSYSDFFLRALTSRLAVLGDIEHAVSLRLHVTEKYRGTWLESIGHQLIEGGNPDGALDVALSVSDRSRLEYVLVKLADNVGDNRLPQLEELCASIETEHYRDEIYETLARRNLAIGENAAAENAVWKMSDSRKRADCLCMPGANATEGFLDEIRRLSEDPNQPVWMRARALSALVSVPISSDELDRVMVLVEELVQRCRQGFEPGRIPVAELLMAVAQRLSEPQSAACRARAVELIEEAEGQEQRFDGFIAMLRWCDELPAVSIVKRALHTCSLVEDVDRQAWWMLRLLTVLSGASQDAVIQILEQRIPKIPDQSTRCWRIKQLAEWCAENGRPLQAVEIFRKHWVVGEYLDSTLIKSLLRESPEPRDKELLGRASIGLTDPDRDELAARAIGLFEQDRHEMALELIGTITDQEAKAAVLEILAAQMPQQTKARAATRCLLNARRIGDLKSLDRQIERLASLLNSAGLYGKALETLDLVTVPVARIKALLRVAHDLPEDQRARVIGKIKGLQEDAELEQDTRQRIKLDLAFLENPAEAMAFIKEEYAVDEPSATTRNEKEGGRTHQVRISDEGWCAVDMFCMRFARVGATQLAIEAALLVDSEERRLAGLSALAVQFPDQIESIRDAARKAGLINVLPKGPASTAVALLGALGEPDAANGGDGIEIHELERRVLDNINEYPIGKLWEIEALDAQLSQELAQRVIVSLFDHYPFIPKDGYNSEKHFDSALIWLAGKLTLSSVEAVIEQIQHHSFHKSHDFDLAARSQMLSCIAMGASAMDHAELLGKLIAFAGEIESELEKECDTEERRLGVRYWSNESLFKVVNLLPRDRQLYLARTAAKVIPLLLAEDAEVEIKAYYLSNMVPALLYLDPTELPTHWVVVLQIIKNMKRSDFLDILDCLTPVIVRLGGKESLYGCAKAIATVGRMWP